MEIPNVVIKSLSKTIHPSVLTSEGKKKFNSKQEITVSLELALQLVDEVNWTCKEDLEKLSKKYGLNKEENAKKKAFSQDEDEEDAPDEEENIDEEADESEDMGDEDIKALIKKIPTMKFNALKEAAEEAGIDVSEYTVNEKAKLKKLLIKTLKGK